MKTVDEVIQQINTYLDQFAQEEHGNRLSQFATAALKQVINQELNELKDVKPEKRTS